MSKLRLLSICVLIIATCLLAALLVGWQPLAQTPETPTPQVPAQTAVPAERADDSAGFPIEPAINGLVLGLTVVVTGGILWKLHQVVSDSRAELEKHLDKRYEGWEKSVDAIHEEREKLIEERRIQIVEQITYREQIWEHEKQALETLAEAWQKRLEIKDSELEQAKDALDNTWNVLSRAISVDLRNLAPSMQSMALRRLAPGIEMDTAMASALEEGKLAQSRVRVLLQAQEQIQELVESRVELDARGYLQLGNAHYQAGDYRRAVAKYGQAIEMAPDDPIPHINLGTAYDMLGEFDAAIDSFTAALDKEAIKNLPGYAAVALNNLGIVYYRLGQIEKALECYSKAIGLKEDYVDAYLNRSVAYEKLGQPRKAAGDRKTAATLHSNLQE